MSLFHGLSAFPITPADAGGTIDTAALARVLARIDAAGADSIGLLGSTGAYAFLSRSERKRAVDAAMATVGGRTPVIVDVGALRTDEAVALASDARAAGADGLLLAPVSYTPLTEDEVFGHFCAVAEAGQLPLCIYNNPGTTKFTFSLALIERLSKVAPIASVKMPLPANYTVEGVFADEIAAIRAKVPQGFSVGYSGDWGAAGALLTGADAFFSVAGGLLPGEMLALVRAAKAGDQERAAEINAAFEPLWSLFRAHGSFRVMYTIADVFGLGRFSPPRPVLGLDNATGNKVKAALDHLQQAF